MNKEETNKKELSDTVAKLIENYAYDTNVDNAMYLGGFRNEAAKIIIETVNNHQQQEAFQESFQGVYLEKKEDFYNVIHTYLLQDFIDIKEFMNLVVDTMRKTNDYHENLHAITKLQNTLFSIDKERTELYH